MKKPIAPNKPLLVIDYINSSDIYLDNLIKRIPSHVSFDSVRIYTCHHEYGDAELEICYPEDDKTYKQKLEQYNKDILLWKLDEAKKEQVKLEKQLALCK